ncbi:Alpha/Beta hydrolase protein [Chytriomyces cf. hyalinus JEL632]|nr:Alpha/Beta hydrolase protein [Chytriomyces cf. hyalinus JEL632]
MLEWIWTTLLLTTLSIMLARVVVNRRGSSRGIAESVLYFVSTALPLALVSRSVFKTTTRVPPQLDALSAAVVDTMRWAQNSNNVAALRRYGAISAARRLRAVRARGAAVMGSNALLAMTHARDSTGGMNAHGVLPSQAPSGIWLAQHTSHLDNVSDPSIVVLLYIHGGGFCCGSPTSSIDSLFDIVCCFNRKEFKKRLVVFSLEYPLAPESRYTAQLDAATSAYWHLVRDLNVSNLLVGGDSGGAHIAINLLNRLAKEQSRASKPIASILFSPCVDPGMTFTPDTPHPISHFDTISTEGARFRSMNAFGNLDGLPIPATDSSEFDSKLPQRPSFDSAQLRQQLKMRDLYRLSSDDLNLAERGTLIVFGGAEIMASAIEHFSNTMQKKGSVDGTSASFLQVAKFDGLPHNFHLIPLTSLKKSGDSARDLVVSFIQKCAV